MSLDWRAFERALTDGLVAAVSAVSADEPVYAAALDHVYRDDDVITLPNLGIYAEDPADFEWDPASWDHYDDEWLPDGRAWQDALTAEATLEEYFSTLVRVCRAARERLGIVVVFLDEGGEEPLVRRVLAADEVARWFPQFAARAAEQARLDALPVAARIARHLERLDSFDEVDVLLDHDGQLRQLGAAATPALCTRLEAPDGWRAAKLLADIGVATPEVIDSLLARIGDSWWTAAALARLGRLDLVLDRADRLPFDVVEAAILAPYRGLRDDAVDPPPLDYGPLAAALARFPGVTLSAGTACCTIRESEVDTALDGLDAPQPLIRLHAVSVLGDRRLGPRVEQRVVRRLARAAEEDGDAEVRRLAGLSVRFWRSRFA